ncbi:MAG: hypothetical protein ACR2QM_01005 [Longimicrobiales bacterium]
MAGRSEAMPFSVGTIGPKDLTGARKVLLRASISRVLRDIAEGIAPLMHLRAQPGSEVTRPRVVTGLASDADISVAEEAVAAGYELWVVLPKPRGEYIEEMEPATQKRAGRMLEQAKEVTEPTSLFGANTFGAEGAPEMLGGQSDTRSRLLTASDLVACIWDGRSDLGPESPGGIAIAAAEQGIPVVWIESTPPHDIRLYGLSEPVAESWNRILPPDVIDRLQKMAKKPEAEDRPTKP